MPLQGPGIPGPGEGAGRHWPLSGSGRGGFSCRSRIGVDAGRRLVDRLRHLWSEGVVVLGLPHGGVPVAAEVARVLDAPLDVIVVRKDGYKAHVKRSG